MGQDLDVQELMKEILFAFTFNTFDVNEIWALCLSHFPHLALLSMFQHIIT